jgi:hypothetical protein
MNAQIASRKKIKAPSKLKSSLRVNTKKANSSENMFIIHAPFTIIVLLVSFL